MTHPQSSSEDTQRMVDAYVVARLTWGRPVTPFELDELRIAGLISRDVWQEATQYAWDTFGREQE